MLRSRWMRVLVGLAGAVALVLVAWNWWLYPSYTIRYRLTVEVQVGDEIKTGSSVIEAEYGWQPIILANPGGWTDVRGEAVFVDLGAGRNIVVTMTNDQPGRPTIPGETTVFDAESLPLFVFGIRPDKRTMAAQIRRARDMGAVEVPLGRLPTTVTFLNPADPKTVRLVQPSELSQVFGQLFV